MPPTKQPEISRLTIPYEKNQEDCEVEIKKWFGSNENRFDLIFRTKNSYVSHSLSFQQLKLLKEKVNAVI